MTISINIITSLLSAGPASRTTCQYGAAAVRAELEKVLAEPHALEGEEAYQGTLADWRSRVAGKAKELADNIVACPRPLKASERGRQMRRAAEAIRRTIEQESYVYARFEAAEHIIYIAARASIAKAPARDSGWMLDQAQEILTGLTAQKTRESGPVTRDDEKWWGNLLDLDGAFAQIRQLRATVGYLQLLNTK